jgi:glycosyltransferase involved in cell wall biosynthesis
MYLGRLSPEKKIDTLLAAWQQLEGTIPLKISGAGSLSPEVEAAAREDPAIEYLGFAPTEEVDRLLGAARLLVFPSGTYEAQPKSILEAFAHGTPAVVSRMGSMEAMVEEGVTGWRFDPGDPADLADVVTRAFNSENLEAMRRAVRSDYLEKYTPEKNYEQLVDIYRLAIQRRKRAKKEDQ